MPVYNWLSDWGIAAGWVIFLMTIATKLILSPVMFKQHKLSAMMKVEQSGLCLLVFQNPVKLITLEVARTILLPELLVLIPMVL